MKHTKRTLPWRDLQPIMARVHRYIRLGYSDKRIAELFGCADTDVRYLRERGEW